MSTLAEVAQRSDEAVARARRDLVDAVRRAHAQGMTQAEIATAIGRSQPEVSRLLRFHGTSPRGMALRKHRAEILGLLEEAGGSNVRVFGSVATGQDHDGSDIDLLVDLPTDVGLVQVSRLERKASEVVGMPVDIVPSDDLRPEFEERVLREAVAL
ncbi:nucleotidyltransferase domain-containing protein [Nocardioides sp. GY 10127]|uniref:nucleotidyltransferase domain-containing protein n=1 Tax=Nocardioides sp. GY 10127 TaxID=2569762 RepID=UPI0010A89CC4|nr:nucleotidyltransferase domain-containing protein [Nocardioides sp. GY 10127]TIC80075.1 toxin-antitoxin system toxin subunit [Nocardioides sp. GY 10127]